MKKFLVHSLTMYNEDAGCALIVEVDESKPEIHKEAVRQFVIKMRTTGLKPEDVEEEMRFTEREMELLLPHADDTPEGTRSKRIGSEFRNVCDRESEIKFSFWRLEETMYLVTEI